MLKIEELLGKNISEYNSQNLNDLKKRVQENKTSWILARASDFHYGVNVC